jgi:hypothetical protein
VVGLFCHPGARCLLPWWWVPAAPTPVDLEVVGTPMLHRVKLVGKGASVLMGRVVVGGEGVLGVSALMPSLLGRAP